MSLHSLGCANVIKYHSSHSLLIILGSSCIFAKVPPPLNLFKASVREVQPVCIPHATSRTPILCSPLIRSISRPRESSSVTSSFVTYQFIRTGFAEDGHGVISRLAVENVFVGAIEAVRRNGPLEAEAGGRVFVFGEVLLDGRFGLAALMTLRIFCGMPC